MSPAGLVAVVVMVRPRATFWAGEKAKVTLPLPSVATDFCPMKTSPSLVPEGLEKNRTTKVLLGLLFSLPRTVLLPSAFLAEEMSASAPPSEGLRYRSGTVAHPPGLLRHRLSARVVDNPTTGWSGKRSEAERRPMDTCHRPPASSRRGPSATRS